MPPQIWKSLTKHCTHPNDDAAAALSRYLLRQGCPNCRLVPSAQGMALGLGRDGGQEDAKSLVTHRSWGWGWGWGSGQERTAPGGAVVWARAATCSECDPKGMTGELRQVTAILSGI